MKIIKRIEIKNFRSFGNRRREITKIDKIEQLNIISGANDSGKSNILRALNLFFNGCTELNEFFIFHRDFFKKGNKDDLDIKEEVVTIKIWFDNKKNNGKNASASNKVFLPGNFWVSKKWKKATEFSQSDVTSNVEKGFEHEKEGNYSGFLDGDKLKSMTKASLQKQLTEYLGAIQYHYIPAIKDRQYFSHLYGELQQTLWKAKRSTVNDKKNELQEEIQKETMLLMDEFKETLNHPSLNFEPAFQLPQNMIDLFKTLQVKTGDVDLRFRGDGVQAKLIPEILHFIAQKEKSFTARTVRHGEQSKKYFIWGFEEPENSYEYRNAQLLADRFKNKFLNHAQIFLTTHSFNFLSVTGDNVGKYRVWKDKLASSSKIAKLKESTSGKITLEGNAGDSDMLLDELGVFYLNEEIQKAYKEVTSIREEYKNKIQAINKPVLYTEGNNTRYLKVAKKLFSPDLEYDIENLGGKSEIKKFFTMFSNAKFSRYKTLFVFDCDARAEFEYCENLKTEHLKPYIFKKNKNNTLLETKKGIENLFDDDLFDDENRCFSITTVDKDGSIQSRTRTLRKNYFLNYITNEMNNEDVFYLFKEIQELINLEFSDQRV